MRIPADLNTLTVSEIYRELDGTGDLAHCGSDSVPSLSMGRCNARAQRRLDWNLAWQAKRRRDAGIATSLFGVFTYRKPPYHVLLGAIAKWIADSGLEAGGVAFIAFQDDLIREEAPGSFTDLVHPAWKLDSVRVGHSEAACINAMYRHREERLHYSILINVVGSRRRVGGYA